MFLSVGASTEAKALHVCSVGSVSTRHAVVCVFLAFIKITISPLKEAGSQLGEKKTGLLPAPYVGRVDLQQARTIPLHLSK